jgi:hypothetical protein
MSAISGRTLWRRWEETVSRPEVPLLTERCRVLLHQGSVPRSRIRTFILRVLHALQRLDRGTPGMVMMFLQVSGRQLIDRAWFSSQTVCYGFVMLPTERIQKPGRSRDDLKSGLKAMGHLSCPRDMVRSCVGCSFLRQSKHACSQRSRSEASRR